MQRRRTRWSGPTLVVAGLAMAACSDDGADTERIATELVDETGGALDEEQASCVAEGLVSSFGDDSFRDVLDAADDPTSDPNSNTDDVRIEVIDIFASCDALEAVMLDEESDQEPDG